MSGGIKNGRDLLTRKIAPLVPRRIPLRVPGQTRRWIRCRRHIVAQYLHTLIQRSGPKNSRAGEDNPLGRVAEGWGATRTVKTRQRWDRTGRTSTGAATQRPLSLPNSAGSVVPGGASLSSNSPECMEDGCGSSGIASGGTYHPSAIYPLHRRTVQAIQTVQQQMEASWKSGS